MNYRCNFMRSSTILCILPFLKCAQSEPKVLGCASVLISQPLHSLRLANYTCSYKPKPNYKLCLSYVWTVGNIITLSHALVQVL